MALREWTNTTLVWGAVDQPLLHPHGPTTVEWLRWLQARRPDIVLEYPNGELHGND